MRLSPDEQSILRALSEPVDQRRRQDFLQEAERRIESASTGSAIGPGLVHRVGRATQREFFDPPRDQRQDRIGPRGVAELSRSLPPDCHRTTRDEEVLGRFRATTYPVKSPEFRTRKDGKGIGASRKAVFKTAALSHSAILP